MVAKKIGRPTENKKDTMLRVRIDSNIVFKLEEISKKENISKSEVVRRGIINQYNDIKK
ncbi:CopG family transcriptional regulator [Gemella sp. oral taxon 928]|uniref:ribbon-helix-helix protein, CopG family n=1 Tax=Gemella sp. oral taxon 928 TaxID=1785995 RepID=UPI00076834F1|nr:ribbon-helix-helix protein, CopG family [Gemella sp. oral taxon 928]AME09648.1 CopG family transcriptional regulator [Gemella sp. oral taxon 928]